MKRGLLVAIPLILLAGLMFVKPPNFAVGTKAGTPATSSTAKPGVPGGGGDDGGKPAYGGESKDNYGK
jgi:hypothetical protein